MDFGRSGKAVGLSAISLLAMFPARSLRIWTRHFDRLSDLVTSPKLIPDSLAKDAAPIPNALAAINNKSQVQSQCQSSVSEFSVRVQCQSSVSEFNKKGCQIIDNLFFIYMFLKSIC